MATAMQLLVDTTRQILFDPSPGSAWSDDEIVEYLNLAVQATCAAKPDVNVLSVELALDDGVVQALPANGILLIDVIKNTTSGKAIIQVDKALLEAADPNWGAATPMVDIDHYTTDPRNPLRFLVYPPAVGSSVTLQYGAVPGLVDIGDNSPLNAIYNGALVSYALSLAFAKPSDRVKGDPAKVALYRQQWAQAVGLRMQSQVANAPRITPGTPT